MLHGLVEARAGARRRATLHPEARLVLADDRDAPRRAGARGRLPAGRRQRRHRPRAARPARRSPRIPGIGKVAFTGETTTGQEIMRLASDNVKKVSLELGGKSPNIVFADADLERFAAESPYSVFDNCGQDCCARVADPRRALGPRAGRRAVRRGDPQGRRRRSRRRQDRGRHAGQLQAARPGEGLHRDRARRGREPRRRRRGAGRSGAGQGAYLHADDLRRRRERHADREGGDLRARSSRSSRSTTRPRRSGWPTPRRTASPARSGAATSAGRCGRRRASRPACCR